MIAFDPAKLTVEVVRFKTISAALGGSATIIDEARTTDKKEVTTRIDVPLAVARAWIVAYKDSRYLKPMVGAVIRYDGHVIALERHYLGGFGSVVEEFADGTKKPWVPTARWNIDRVLPSIMAEHANEWFFDGRYVYAFANFKNDAQAIASGDHLSESGCFRKVNVRSIDLQLVDSKEIFPGCITDRTCLAYVSPTGAFAISPPIWKDLSDVGMTQFKKEDKAAKENGESVLVEDKEAMRHNFDRIDAQMSVNLNFVLTAGREIGKTFGYEFVEPLQLPRLMVELHTVNLPNLPKEIKHTYDCGIKFSHALAWLLGLTRRANTLETHITMRSLMKYLTKRGLFRTSAFEHGRVFQEGKAVGDVPQKKLDDLLQNQDFTKISLAAILETARESRKGRKENDHVGLGG